MGLIRAIMLSGRPGPHLYKSVLFALSFLKRHQLSGPSGHQVCKFLFFDEAQWKMLAINCSLIPSSVDWRNRLIPFSCPQGLGCVVFSFFLSASRQVLHEASSSPSIAEGAQLTVPLRTTVLSFAEILGPSTSLRFLARTIGSLFSFLSSFLILSPRYPYQILRSYDLIIHKYSI